MSKQELEAVCCELGLNKDMPLEKKLQLDMTDPSQFTAEDLQKVALARIFCAVCSVYILDSPYRHLPQSLIGVVDNILRRKQK